MPKPSRPARDSRSILRLDVADQGAELRIPPHVPAHSAHDQVSLGRHFRPDEANNQSLTRWFLCQGAAQPVEHAAFSFIGRFFRQLGKLRRCHPRAEFLRHTDNFLSCFVHAPPRSANQKRRVTMTTLVIDSIAIGLAPASVRSTAATGVQH